MTLRRAIVAGWDTANSVPKGVASAVDVRSAVAPAIRPGVFRTADDACAASGTATMAVDLQKFVVSIGSPLGGDYVLSADDVESVELDASDSTNDRIDVIYVMQEDYQVDPTKVDSNPVVGKVTGTPAVSPTAPVVPTGAYALWECAVPAGAVNTNDGVVFTPVFDWTVAVGGAVPFRTKAEMDLWTSAPAGTAARVLADNGEYVRGGGAWLRGGPTHLQLDTTNTVAGVVTQYGMGKIAGAATANITEAITFPKPFAGVPFIQAGYIGARATSAWNPPGTVDFSGDTIGKGFLPSTTGLSVLVYRTGGANLISGWDFYYSWSATGVLA